MMEKINIFNFSAFTKVVYCLRFALQLLFRLNPFEWSKLSGPPGRLLNVVCTLTVRPASSGVMIQT